MVSLPYANLLPGEPLVRTECLPFTLIPHTSRLFADYLSYAPPVRQFYPRNPDLKSWAADEASKLRYSPERRQRVTAILERQNEAWGATAETRKNLERLRAGAACVVTGQQVGLFAGPWLLHAYFSLSG